MTGLLGHYKVLPVVVVPFCVCGRVWPCPTALEQSYRCPACTSRSVNILPNRGRLCRQCGKAWSDRRPLANGDAVAGGTA